MSSQNKKNKARNSYLYNGGDKIDGHMKRCLYYTKRQRKKGNIAIRNYINERKGFYL